MPAVGVVTRRVLAGLVTWALTLGVVAVGVHPERCGLVAADEAFDAATAAARWLSSNIDQSGRFTYRYDRDRQQVLGGYSEPRHAGALLSLYQAAAAGITDAESAADLGLAWALERVVETPIGPAFGQGSRLETGSTALLVAAMVERRNLNGSTTHDQLLIDLGKTLEATVTPAGAVDAVIDLQDGPIAERSPFYTGETLWALSRLHLTFPDQGFSEGALRVRHYLIADRDDVESPWPPISDHWGSYAFETMSRWPSPPLIDAAAREWIDRQMWLLGLQVRYESQRVGGVTRLTRGDVALPAGIGTVGEALANWLLFDEREPVLGDDLVDVQQRAVCAASLLVERQTPGNEPFSDLADPSTAGAWFRLGITQVDDQQHPLSALLLTVDWMTP